MVLVDVVMRGGYILIRPHLIVGQSIVLESFFDFKCEFSSIELGLLRSEWFEGESLFLIQLGHF